MILRTLSWLICSAALVVPSIAQRPHQVTLRTEDAPALHIRSAQIDVDTETRKVTLSVEVENTGDKTIMAFVWEYRTQGVIRDYNVSVNASMPEVAMVLAPKERKRVLLLENAQVQQWILNMPAGRIEIASIAFEDGSSWKGKNDVAK